MKERMNRKGGNEKRRGDKEIDKKRGIGLEREEDELQIIVKR